MNSEEFFLNDLKVHKAKVEENILKIIKELNKRLKEHDNDKLQNPIIYDKYAKYSQKQRSLPYGSKEREEIENGSAMGEATRLHVIGNRHHFYDERNSITNNLVDLVDLIEVLCDWISAMRRNPLTKDEEIERLNLIFEKHKIPNTFRQLLLNTYNNYL